MSDVVTLVLFSLFSKPINHAEAGNPSVWPPWLPGLPSNTGCHGNITLLPALQRAYFKQHSTGCEWKGKYEDHMQHSNMCGKLPVKCDNIGCGEMVRREEMAIHMSQCQKQEIPCQDCGKGMARDSMGHPMLIFCAHTKESPVHLVAE